MNEYIVDVTYDDGSVALFGPFGCNVKTNVRAIDFVDWIKNAPNSCVKEAKIRVLNKPRKII